MQDKARQLRDEVTQLLEQAEATHAAVDATYGADVRGDELPAGLQRPESRLKRIREATRALKSGRRKTPRRRASRRMPPSPIRRPSTTSPIPSRGS